MAKGIEAFLGDPEIESQRIYEEERFPNLAVALDGTVLATWGAKNVVVRRSEDGGATWGPTIPIGSGIHGAGVTVDEGSGHILAFTHPEHPPGDGVFALRSSLRSTDAGQTWQEEEPVFEEDVNGNVPSLHFHEHGITLSRGTHKGRIIRPARVYERPKGYNTAIYSDDGGRTWKSSAPFELEGTGEGAIAELSDGRIYYSSRQHWFDSPDLYRSDRLHAFSSDGGQTWGDFGHSNLPDGPRHRSEEKQGACYNGHFGMAAGLVRLPVEDRDILIYSNADLEGHDRIRMTVWASFDGGESWPIKRLVDEGPSAYSSLEAGRPGTPGEGWIFLQYEDRNGGGFFSRLRLSWILEGTETGDGTVPSWVG